MDYKYIEQLLERYFEAQTTLNEEQILRSFFSQEDEVPEHLRQYQPLFTLRQSLHDEETLGADFDEKMLRLVDNPSTVKARTITLRHRFQPLLKAAAIVLLFLTLGNIMERAFTSDAERMSTGAIIALKNDTVDVTAPSVAYDHNTLTPVAPTSMSIEGDSAAHLRK